MKLRLHGNSIRLRLNRSEVAEFLETGRLQDALPFGEGATLAYALELCRETLEPRASFKNNVIRIMLPAEQAREWAQSDRVGICAREGQLSILVEKDFQCLHEPDPDAYPNPDAAHH